MKKIIYSLTLLLLLGFLFETASAQSEFSPSQSVASAVTAFKISQLSNPLQVNQRGNGSIGSDAMAYPNPCNGQFTLRFNSPNGGKTGITVKDNRGNGMLAIETLATIGTNLLKLNIRSYGPGIYSITISGGGTASTVQVVVNK